MGFAPTWLRQVSPPPLLHMTTLTTGLADPDCEQSAAVTITASQYISAAFFMQYFLALSLVGEGGHRFENGRKIVRI